MPNYVEIHTKIIQLPETTEADKDNDYLLLDSPTLGTRCILVKNFKREVANNE